MNDGPSLEARNRAYVEAVPHGISGFYPSFQTAATILRIARRLNEIDDSVCERGGDLAAFFELLDEVELELPTVRVEHAAKRPFVVAVEGLDGCGKSTVVRGLAEDLGGRACATPSSSLIGVRPAFDKRGGPVARAFYTVSNYVLQHEILKDERHSVFVVDRWFSSTCAYSIAWKNTTGGPEAIDALPPHLFRWPEDLHPPQLQLLLRLEDSVRIARVKDRAAGISDTSRYNPWDQRLTDDLDLGRRIMRAHERSIGPEGQAIVDASLSRGDVLSNALDVVKSSLKFYREPWLAFERTPMDWFRWQSSRLKLCDDRGRRLKHAPWAIQLAASSSLRSVGTHTADDSGILFHTWGDAAGGASDGDESTVASVVCVLEDYPNEQQWRAEGVLMSNTSEVNRLLDQTPPASLVAQVSACASTTASGQNEDEIRANSNRPRRPENYDRLVREKRRQLGRSEANAVVGTRFVPFRMEVLMGGPSSPGGPKRFEWQRGPWNAPSSSVMTPGDNGWSPVGPILPFSPPRSVGSPSVEVLPITLVLVGTHCAGKSTIGKRVAEVLGYEFQLELGNILREPDRLEPDAHRYADGIGRDNENDDWDTQVFRAECERDARWAEKDENDHRHRRRRHRVVETWHVGNLSWAESRKTNGDRGIKRSKLVESTHAAIKRARETSLVLVALLRIDPDTTVRRRRSDSGNAAARLPMSSSSESEECRRLHGFLDEGALPLTSELGLPTLTVSNHADGEDAQAEACRKIIRFVLREQWRRVVGN